MEEHNTYFDRLVTISRNVMPGTKFAQGPITDTTSNDYNDSVATNMLAKVINMTIRFEIPIIVILNRTLFFPQFMI